jgi:sec-independent protein translocase protein TatA
MHGQVLLFLSNLFSSDMIIIVFVALLLFGGEKLPEIARGLGKGIRDFKDASEGVKREINNQINSYEEKKAEEALNKKAEDVQNQLPGSTDALTDGHPAVENTVAVNDSYFNSNEHADGIQNELPVAPGTENHAEGHHTDAGATTETIKNL